MLADQLGECLFLVIHLQSNLHPLDNKVREKLYNICALGSMILLRKLIQRWSGAAARL
jgi:hypothetical protein